MCTVSASPADRPNGLLYRITGGARRAGESAASTPLSTTSKYGRARAPPNEPASPDASEAAGGKGPAIGKPTSWVPASWADQVPSLQLKIDPTTTLKVRKKFYPVGTKFEIGADFNTQLSVWQLRSSWEDNFIKGELAIKGRELQYTKAWTLPFSANEMLFAKLRLNAGLDLVNFSTFVRIGFRTEQASAEGGSLMDGFPLTYIFKVPINNNSDVMGLQFKGRIALPKPSFEMSTGKKADIGLGDGLQVNLDEVNVLVDI